nr:RNA-directed DNA polymerase, eukaryota [Tanacetum cinerariifolium]
SYRSKEDDVNRISTSIFVTNFSESFYAKDLFQSCKQYGHVVDSFIPLKRSKEGKRFGFVRFINVFSVERLRVPLNSNKVYEKKNVESFRGGDQISRKDVGGADSGKSFVNVVKSIYKSRTVDCEANPAIVLDDDCLNSKDLTNSLLGRVKEFVSLSNLKMVLTNEGFVDISVRYMGELWVLLEFASTKSKELFRDNVGVGFWFSELKQASFDFNLDDGVVWVEVFWIRAKEVPGWGPELLEESDEEVQSDDGSMEGDNKVNLSDDPFGIYPLLNKNIKENKENVNEKDQSLEYPLGFTPNAEENDRNVNGDKSQKCNTKEVFAGRDGDSTNKGSKGDASESTPNAEENDRNVNEVFAGRDGDSINRGSKGDASESVCTGRFKKSEVPRTRGSFLCLMEEVVKVGQIMGYNMEGCLAQKAKKDWGRELCANNKVNFLAIQETKIENIELRCVRSCWGNYAFDYIHSNSVGNSRGILCAWDPNSFRKSNYTISDSFVIIRGVWLKNGIDLLIVAVYAHHDPRDKHMLWDYLVHTINQWDGEVVITGDFNEVPHKSDRHNRTGMKEKYKEELRTLDDDIDNGNGSDIVIHKRMEVINALQRIDKLNAMEITQNTKIKCNRFDKPMEHRAVVNMCYPRSLLIDQQEDLERMVTKEEVKRAVWDCGTDKSSGLDGFTFGFYRQFWLTIKNDVFEAVSNFFTHADIPKGCNPSFIALISKVSNANKVNDFRPISLIGSIYKIIAKILVNRLVRVLGDIVNEVQSTFIADRKILDGPFILNEVLQWCKIKKKQSLIFKVDFEKSYDSVRWDFLDDVLKKFGFGNKWCDWIQTCLKSSRGFIMINGSPTKEFQFCKGLKQGDPLSLFLFILIMESLHLSFQRMVDAGLFMGIKLSHLVNLSHMFYVNDAVFVGQWSDSNINTLIHALDCFYRASGLRMNISKSKIMGVHVEGRMVKHAASKLGCLTLNTPFCYLGSKVGGFMSRVQAWKEVINKVKSRLSKWKMKTLSIGGRLTLLKSMLGSIPMFHMSIFRVPSSVLHTLESIRNQYFNGHEVGSNKATWVKWNSVLTAKDSEGLGVSSLYALNRGLMMKWVWRFYNQKTSLWANVIKAIHEEEGSMGKAKYAGVRTCWTTIVNEIRILSDQGVNVLKFMRLKLGNGDMASFWNDNWSGGCVLKDLYPRLYALENGKSVNVCTKLSDPSMDYSFPRKTRGGAEQEQLDTLMDLVSTVNFVSMGDRWVWTLGSSGEFSVASLRKVIDEKRLPSVCSKTR